MTSVSPTRFREHLAWIDTQGYQVTTLARVVAQIASGTLPSPRSVVLTFDDGDRSVADIALPELARRGYAATVFVITGDCGARRSLPGMLTRSELLDLHRAGFDLGAHSITHPRLSRLDDSEVGQELDGSRMWLEDLTGAAVSHFAYPFGAFDQRVRTMVAERFESACGVELRALGASEDLYRLPRIDAYYLDGLLRTGGPDRMTGRVWLHLRRVLRNVRAVLEGDLAKAGRDDGS